MDKHSMGTWEDDPLYGKAVMLAQARKRLTYADLQRALFIGFNRSARLLEEMERRGVLKCVPTERGGHWQLVA